MDGFGLVKRVGKRYPVVLMFSGDETMETRKRGLQEGACYLMDKPLRDVQIYFIWQQVVQWRCKAAGAAMENPDTPRKRRQGLNDSNKGKGASEGGLQLGTTKKKKVEWTTEMHELFVNAVTQLKTTGDEELVVVKEEAIQKVSHLAITHGDDVHDMCQGSHDRDDVVQSAFTTL
uniref:Response regulatory domain-containing protein n=1 Tax=Triticum urartu TaxID=4572 RepID=A0A8R7UQD0_TRIUA